MKSGITTSKNGIKIYNLTFLHYVCMVVAGGKEGQLAVVGEEEEVRERLYFCICRQWGGWGDLTVIEQGFRGIDLGKGLHECISDSNMLQRLALAVSVLLFSAAAWSHD